MLLKDSYDWKPDLIPKIRAQPAEFDLLPLAEVYMNCVRRLCLEAIELKAARLEELRHYLVRIMEVFRVPPGGLPVLFSSEPTAPGTTAAFQPIPIQQLGWVVLHLDWLRRDCTIAAPEIVP